MKKVISRILPPKYRLATYVVDNEIRFTIEERYFGVFYIAMWYSTDVDSALDILNGLRQVGHTLRFPKPSTLEELRQIEKIQNS
jgi:hypothetical protein